jgi:translation initiation factor IF-3
MGHPDSEPKLLGKQINVMLTPLPANKRKPKFDTGDEELPEDPDVSHDDEDEDEDEPGKTA